MLTIPKNLRLWLIRKNKQNASKHLGRWGVHPNIVEKQIQTIQYNDYCMGPPKHSVYTSKQ